MKVCVVGGKQKGYQILIDATVEATRPFYDLPAIINPSSKYIFFLHGMFAEIYGPNGIHPRFGIYDYHGIVKAFADRGFTVISEIRRKKTNPYKYAGKVARQIKTLLANCVSPEQITVAGFSKGGTITLYTAAKIREHNVSYVVMGGCSHNGAAVLRSYNKSIGQLIPFIKGRFLSIYDASDQKCNICQKVFKTAPVKATFKEIKVKNGLGHGLFYQPRKDWLEPVVDWINRKDSYGSINSTVSQQSRRNNHD
jgi:dienelactone hydrolase